MAEQSLVEPTPEALEAMMRPGPIQYMPAPPSGPAALLDLMRSGISADAVKAVAEIYEREQSRQAEREFNSALAAFQSEMHVIGKSRKADRYMYAPLDDIAQQVRPLLDKHGFGYSFDSDLNDHGVAVTFVLRHRGGHSERTKFTAPVDAAMRVNATQKVGSALTYGKRYAMLAGLGLSTGDVDDDAKATTDTITENQAADLRALLEESGRTEASLCKIYGVESVDALPANMFNAACQVARQAIKK